MQKHTTADLQGGTPEDFDAFMRNEPARWSVVAFDGVFDRCIAARTGCVVVALIPADRRGSVRLTIRNARCDPRRRISSRTTINRVHYGIGSVD